MMDRTAIALLLSAITFVLTVIWGPPLIRALRALKVGDSIRLELPDSYLAKMGTPTMGGVMFIIPTICYKFMIQLALSAVIGYGLYMVLDVPRMFIPGINFEIDLGWWHIPIAIFIILSEVNAVNFTDGMDGLAGLISATAFASFGAIAVLQGQIYVAQFCFTLVGALFGFLWFNVHPAQLIMGDTGSMALGSALAVVALMTGQWLLLLVIGIIPLMEALSVVIQVTYFKRTGGKRIFKMTPIHLHFQLLGWSETQVVQRFWLISLLAGLMGVALAVI
ncbi:MAG: phospho-N-acetylmuramoyl-pentapeptide-transferase [Anaerolineales bacterium]